MSDAALTTSPPRSSGRSADRQRGSTLPTVILFIVLLTGGLGYAVYGLVSDMHQIHAAPLAIGTLVLLGFEFVKGFHDAANPVATVIYTRGLSPSIAANGSGLQMKTLRNLGLVWVLTLPVAVTLAGCLYWLLHFVF